MSSITWRENLVEEENRNKLAKAEDEYQEQLSRLIAFEKDGTHWSGTGERLDVVEENLEDTFRRELAQGEELSAGTYGIVRKVVYRRVTLVVKEMKLKWLSLNQIEQLKQEAFIGQRLDSHIHVIKHVGTYYQGYNTADCRLNILTFPVAICDLGQFLEDCEEIIQPVRDRLYETMDIGKRLVALGFHASREKTELKVEIQTRLHEIMGCLAEAIEWMHSNNVRHRDLKPANILLRPGQVLLTDFGISRHRIVGETTSTETDVGFTWGYAAPEVLKTDGIGSLAKADVYSLGCIFLHLLTVIYGPNVDLGVIPSNLPQPRGRHHLREKLFRKYLDSVPDTAQCLPAHQFIPPIFIKLLADVLHVESDRRPTISDVNSTLRELCSTDEWLYGSCCHRREKSTEHQRIEQPKEPESSGTNSTQPSGLTSWQRADPIAQKSRRAATESPRDSISGETANPSVTKRVQREESEAPNMTSNGQPPQHTTQTPPPEFIRNQCNFNMAPINRARKMNTVKSRVDTTKSSTPVTYNRYEYDIPNSDNELFYPKEIRDGTRRELNPDYVDIQPLADPRADLPRRPAAKPVSVMPDRPQTYGFNDDDKNTSLRKQSYRDYRGESTSDSDAGSYSRPQPAYREQRKPKRVLRNYRKDPTSIMGAGPPLPRSQPPIVQHDQTDESASDLHADSSRPWQPQPVPKPSVTSLNSVQETKGSDRTPSGDWTSSGGRTSSDDWTSSAAQSLRYARPQDLPSYPISGLPPNRQKRTSSNDWTSSAAQSLRYARPQDLPSYPTSGLPPNRQKGFG